MIRYIYIILLLAISSGLYAQEKDALPKRYNRQKQDSAKKQRIFKEWTLSHDYSEEVIVPFDTVFSLSNRFKIADKYSPVNAGLGNYGLPFYQLSFFDRISDPDMFLYSTYYPFMHLPSNALFMNTQVPYTELDWSFAGTKPTSEQTFRVRHSQNINRFLNFGLIYDIIFSLGQYNYQRAEDKTFTFYTSYTKEKYKLYFSAGINNLISFENGGLVNGADLSTNNTLGIETNLASMDKAKSTLKNRNLLLVQRYTFGNESSSKKDSTLQKQKGFLGLSGTFSHILELESNARNYYDANPGSEFYNAILITRTITSDSVNYSFIKNTVRFDFSTDETRKFRLGGGVGIRNEILKYTYITPVPFLFAKPPNIIHRNSNVLIGKLFNNIGDNFRWTATGELYATGYRIGDFKLNGDISKSFNWKKGKAFWLITGSMTNIQPSVWFEHWGGNNIEWNNNFKKEFRIDLGSAFQYPARKTELKFNYAIIKNYTDFGTNKLPSQYSGGLSVVAITLKNELRVWKFHLASDVIVQKSSNSNILDLPLATVRSAGYFEHFFKFKKTGGNMNLQLGTDVTYNTLYHPYSYMPATGRFYRQVNVTAGNYPFINVFLNFKVRRTRVFIVSDHINARLMGEKIKYNYYYVPAYPVNIRMLRYGLAWTFYD